MSKVSGKNEIFTKKKIYGAYFEFKFFVHFSSIFKFPNPKIMV